MLLIPTFLAESTIPGAGLGVFCRDFVPAGTIIWAFHPGFDYVVEHLPDDPTLAAFVQKYGYVPLDDGPRRWVMCADDARFFNHSDDPSCLDEGEFTTARFDLAPRTELTSDYRAFCREPFAGFAPQSGTR